jgi:predicted Zn finger-like uncharacterized protein
VNKPKCFISYSWDDEDHQCWVRDLAIALQSNGVLVHLDQWDVQPGIDLAHFMETSIRACDYVLIICTPIYAQKANRGTGGVGYEKTIITGEIFEDIAGSAKFVPILRTGYPIHSLPSYLKTRFYIDLRKNSNYEENFESLLRHLYGRPKYERPLLGERPIFENFPHSNQLSQKAAKRQKSTYAQQKEPASENNEEKYRLAGAQIECPYCMETFYTEKSGRIECPECKETFTIDRNTFELIGKEIECPYCRGTFYTEKSGRTQCPECAETFTITENSLELVGKETECPYCDETFYTENSGEIRCPECGNAFTVGENDHKPIGARIECPYCDETFYIENSGEIRCPECGNVFTVDENDRKPIGARIECPHCMESFYAEKSGKIECPECNAAFTVKRVKS